ncbi:ORF6N domain-containing protein [Clostridium sp.]|uniref:ORF6N domain-containing protein n=1 Tax=Clostridium sp. TaxID=1506 RepID=UPI002A8E71B9|nr:ORF6N domain-containing protein [Clostridium sp.]
MNKQIVKINNTDLSVKELNGQRVVTFKDIDMLHERVEGTANKRFIDNKKHFIADEDYFEITGETLREFKRLPNFGIGEKASKLTLITESGYLMLVKSLQDDLAWKVQRELVNNYFRVKEFITNVKPQVDNLLKEKEIEARLKNARAREANILLKICSNPNLSKEYVQVLQSKATEIITGQAILPLPVAERKTYSATEIGKMLGISANKVGSLANKHNLKTDEYGKLFHDKSRYSSKEVESFRYYEEVIPVLKSII